MSKLNNFNKTEITNKEGLKIDKSKYFNEISCTSKYELLETGYVLSKYYGYEITNIPKGVKFEYEPLLDKFCTSAEEILNYIKDSGIDDLGYQPRIYLDDDDKLKSIICKIMNELNSQIDNANEKDYDRELISPMPGFVTIAKCSHPAYNEIDFAVELLEYDQENIEYLIIKGNKIYATTSRGVGMSEGLIINRELLALARNNEELMNHYNNCDFPKLAEYYEKDLLFLNMSEDKGIYTAAYRIKRPGTQGCFSK